jgi:hypothetical protein
MTETAEAGDRDLQQSGTPADTGEPQAAPAPEEPGPQAQAGPALPAGAREVDELTDQEPPQGKPEEQQGPERAEVAGRKQYLDEQQRRLDEGSARQGQWIKRQEQERLIEFGRSGISLHLLGERDAEREDQLFVPPGDYQRFVDEITRDSGKHVLLIAGPESSGKLMTAFYLARHAWKPGALRCYRYCAQDSHTLLGIWADENLPDNAVMLFDDVFDKKLIDPDDLTNRYVHLNERLAEKHNVWFIFTVRAGPTLERLRAARPFPTLFTTRVDRRQVFEKLIDYYFPLDSPAEGARACLLTFAGELPGPAHLNRVFERTADPQAILQGLMATETPEQEEPADWFASLEPMNYQLYALLAVLFDRLEIQTLEEVYTAAVHALRRQGMDGPCEFIDPRRIGTDRMHAALGLQVRYTLLEFRQRFRRQYVEAQVENYQRLLWSLIDPDDPSTFEGLVGLLRRLSKVDAALTERGAQQGLAAASLDRSRQLRSAIALMIARVGIYHQTKLDLLLDRLVRDESAVVALTAAQVLAEIARRGMHFEASERIVRAWIHSGQFDQMWVAAPSIVYIYRAIAGVPEPQERREETDLEDREEEDRVAEDQRRDRDSLARLRDLLTELVKVHGAFSPQTIEEAARSILQTHLAGLQRSYEESAEPVTEHGRLFRELTDGEKQRVVLAAYAGSKQAIDEAVQRDLGVLKNSWLNQMRMVLVQTLGHLMQLWPRDVTHLVRMWLDRKDREDPQWEIGHMGLNYLFQESLAINDPLLLEQAAYPLLDLIPLAMRAHTLTLGSILQDVNLVLHVEELEHSMTLEQHLEVANLLGGDTLLYALSALQRWYENLGQERSLPEARGAVDEEEEVEEDGGSPTTQGQEARRSRWQERVSAVLANAINRAPQQERQRLRSALSLWVKTGDRDLSRIARILISHAYAMDGIVLDLPGSRRAGLVVVDSQRRGPEDRERMFALLHNLAALVPIHLHWLGYTRSRRRVHSDHHAEPGQEGSAAFGPDDLLLRSAGRPALLLPILQPGQGPEYTPAETYFVVIFTGGEILDLAELYAGLPAGAGGPAAPDVFLRHLQSRAVATRSSDQPWQGKVYVQSNGALAAVPESLALLLTEVRATSMDALEAALGKRVALTLRTCPAPELWQELRACIGGPVPRAPTVAWLSEEIGGWLGQLADTSTLTPDVSLFILWTVMVRSRENLAEARQLVELLLQEPEDSGSEPQGKQARRASRLRQQMGIACTRMLFHLYGSENPALAVEPYAQLLLLLPRMMACASSASELIPVLSILFELVRNESWLQIVNEDEGALFACIGQVPARELDLVHAWVQNHQYLVALSRVFLDAQRPLRDFVDSGAQIPQRARPPRVGRQPGGAPPDELARAWLGVLPAENNAAQRERYAWALSQLEFQQAYLRQPGAGEAVRAGLRNQERLLNHLGDEIQARQDGTIEPLQEGSYGVVLVEAGSRDAVHQAFLVVQEFVTQRRQHKELQVTLALQRLGEKEPLARMRTGRKIRKEREIGTKRPLLPVMGPLLARYPAEQVAFVLLITASPVLDYDDWVEQESWAGRIWLASLDDWQPYGGEMVALGESTPLTLQTILNVGGEQATR